MLRAFLLEMGLLPVLVSLYGFVQRQTTRQQSELRRLYAPRTELFFGGYLRWFPYLAMAIGGGACLVFYASGALNGTVLLALLDAIVGTITWQLYMGPRFQSERELQLRRAGELGEIARELLGYNDRTYGRYRSERKWRRVTRPPNVRMADNDHIDVVLRLIARAMAERLAAATWSRFYSDHGALLEEALKAIADGRAQIELAQQFCEFHAEEFGIRRHDLIVVREGLYQL